MISDNIAVGASTANFGLFGNLIAYLMINWDALERYGPMRCMSLCMISIIILMNILASLGSNSTVDNYGHLGGFIVGIFLSFVIVKPIQPDNHHNILYKIGYLIIISFFVLGFILFYTTRHPS